MVRRAAIYLLLLTAVVAHAGPVTASAVPTVAWPACVPFVALLLMIALGPLLFGGWWSRHYPKVAVALAAVTLTHYLIGLRAVDRVLHTGAEYTSFVCLIGSLFVVSGGIHIEVRGESTPGRNVLFLLMAALIANVLGTTGASMLLIRPWIRMNQGRITARHIVFFIFIVSNVGGGLTPIGDPPLFLGYLRGVPFWWVMQQCWPMWLTALAMLLAIFYVLDRRDHLRARRLSPCPSPDTAAGWRLEGGVNLLFLGVILFAVFLPQPQFLREGLMVAAAAGSWLATRPSIHHANQFSFHPVKEVAILFLGLFATMMPALDWLGAHAASLGAPTPGMFYWAAGSLSSVLDNAPTYLCFFEAAASLHASGATDPATLMALPEFTRLLSAVSVGAVFFGACTYIGNGPNFMVKAIAEQHGAPIPTFLGYVAGYTLPILLPVLTAVWWIFFRR